MRRTFHRHKCISSLLRPALLLAIITIITMGTTGCQAIKNGFNNSVNLPSTKEELIAYLNENMQEDYEIISGPVVDEKDINKYIWANKYIWTVKTKVLSFPDPVIFHIYQYKSSQGYFSYSDDFSGEVMKRVFKEYDGWEDDFYLDEDDIVCNIYNRDDFLTAADKIARFAVFLKNNHRELEHYLPVNIYYRLKYMDFPSGITSNYGRCYSFQYDHIPSCLEKELNTDILQRDYSVYNFISPIKKAELERLHLLMQYGFIDKIAEYSPDERFQCLTESDQKIYIEKQSCPADDTGYICTDDKMGYGTLFYILNEYGYDVTGTWDKFSFTGKDGKKYTLDYADCDYSDNEPLVNAAMIKRVTGIPFEKKKSGEENIWLISM